MDWIGNWIRQGSNCMFVDVFGSLLLPLCPRSLSELEGLSIQGPMGDKIKQVTERATLFRITSNAMINVSYSAVQWNSRRVHSPMQLYSV